MTIAAVKTIATTNSTRLRTSAFRIGADCASRSIRSFERSEGAAMGGEDIARNASERTGARLEGALLHLLEDLRRIVRCFGTLATNGIERLIVGRTIRHFL